MLRLSDAKLRLLFTMCVCQIGIVAGAPTRRHRPLRYDCAPHHGLDRLQGGPVALVVQYRHVI